MLFLLLFINNVTCEPWSNGPQQLMTVNDSRWYLKGVLLFEHQLSCTFIGYHQISFILSLFKFFMIVHDSFSRLTMPMIVHVFWSAVLVITGAITFNNSSNVYSSKISATSSTCNSSTNLNILLSYLTLFLSLVRPLFHQHSPDSSSVHSSNKWTAALFHRKIFTLKQVCPTRRHFSVHSFTQKEPGTSCLCDFAHPTVNEPLSTNFFGRSTMWMIVIVDDSIKERITYHRLSCTVWPGL